MSRGIVIVYAVAQAGFFRLGRHWPHSGTRIDPEEFSAEEQARLRSDPHLRIEVRDSGDVPLPEEEIVDIVAKVLPELGDDDFRKDGKPKIDAVRAKLGPRITDVLTVELVEKAHAAFVEASKPAEPEAEADPPRPPGD